MFCFHMTSEIVLELKHVSHPAENQEPLAIYCSCRYTKRVKKDVLYLIEIPRIKVFLPQGHV